MLVNGSDSLGIKYPLQNIGTSFGRRAEMSLNLDQRRVKKLRLSVSDRVSDECHLRGASLIQEQLETANKWIASLRYKI